ncbi:MAG: type II toxin-antitoxin system HipA family toxin [Bacteroidota bacterium]
MTKPRTGLILFKGRQAGRLTETATGGSVFVYDDGFEEDIACTLPTAQREHAWPVGLPPFFQHLGPEGWLRARQARTGEIADQDDLGLLLRYGQDCIGAVSVEDLAPPAAPDGRALDALTQAAVEAKRTISGVQPKLLARREGDRLVHAGVTGPAPLIAKFPTDDLPSLVPNEYLSMEAARLLLGKDEVAPTERGQIDGLDLPALIIERFDRTPTGDKLRLEDFAQILAKPRGLDFSGKYDAGFEDIGAALQRHSARPIIDLARFFERVVAFALLGNCDCHLKNFSLLETADGLRLSPAYDVVNTYIYGRQGYSTHFGLRVDGHAIQWDQVGRDVLTALGRRLGLQDSAVKRTFLRLAGRKDALLARLRPNVPVEPDDWRELYRATVVEACGRILP